MEKQWHNVAFGSTNLHQPSLRHRDIHTTGFTTLLQYLDRNAIPTLQREKGNVVFSDFLDKMLVVVPQHLA